MRRALVLVSVFAAALLGSSPAAFAAEAPIRNPEFNFAVDGFHVQLRTGSESEKAVLTLYRRGQVADYEAPAEITEDSIKARFGDLGELNYTFTPGAGKHPRCKGADGKTEGTFRGTFDFTGENHYVSFEADHAHGTFELFPAVSCEEAPKSSKPSAGTSGKAKAGKAKPGARRGEAEGAEAEEATLVAAAIGGRLATTLLALPVPSRRGKSLIAAFHSERLKGMVVQRGAEVLAGRGGFRWNLAAGTAHLAPPAPFTGSAVFERRPRGKSIWRGSLRAPVLGGRPMRLTGPKFRASLGSGSLLSD